MTDTLTIYHLGTNDRSCKVRWLAHELGLPVENKKLAIGDHLQAPYREINPYGKVPAAKWRGHTMFESTAICTYLAENFPEKGLIVAPGDKDRALFLEWQSICSDTLEGNLVDYFLAGVGRRPAESRKLIEKSLKADLDVTLTRMPKQGFLVADRLTLADIYLSYSLFLALSCELLPFDQVKDYLLPFMDRPAAKAAQFFDALKDRPN